MATGAYHPAGGLIPSHWHHLMLIDERRCSAFRRAIERTMRPGDVVLDVGAGTGLLSYFAAQHARMVYAVEADPGVAALGRRLIELNGLQDKVQYVEGRAQEHLPPEPVDLVLCEMMHVGLTVEQQVPVLNLVRRALTRAFPDHPYRVVPEGAVHYCQLLQVDFNFHGYRAPFRRLGDTYSVDPAIRPLSPLARYQEVDFGAEVDETVSAGCRLTADADAEVNAIRILTQTALSYDEARPPTERLIDWYLNYLVLPLPTALPVRVGQSLEVPLDYRAGCSLDEIAFDVREPA